MSVASAGRGRAAKTAVRLLVTFSAAAIGAGLGRALVTTYLPVLLERIRDAPGLIGTVMLVNTAAGLLVPLAVGVWSDRLRDAGHGRTVPFVLGGSVLAGGGLAALALGHASSYLLLAAFAAVTYTGLNAVTTGHRALIAEDFEADQRAAATGSEEVAMLIGTLAGVVIGGVLIELEGWAPFALGALLLPVLAVPTVRRMRGRERRRDRIDRERRGARYYLNAARIPGGRLLLVAQGLWVLGYVGLPPFFVLYADHELGLRPSAAALMLAAFGIVTGAAMLLAASVKPQHQRTGLLAGAGVMGVGLLAIAASSSVGPVAAALLPVAVGFGVVTTLGFPAFAAYIPDGEEGAYSALYFSVRSVASAIALPAAGWIIALTDSYRSLFVLGGCAALAALAPLVALGGGRAARAARRVPPYAAAAVGATALAMAGGLLVEHTALLEVDKDLFSLLNGAGTTPVLVDRLLVDPHIQNYVVLTVLTALAAHRLGDGGGLRSALTVAGAALLAYAMVRLCWAVWERPRPEEVLGTAPANGHSWGGYPSFPSGHVAVTTAIVAAAAALVPPLRVVLWAYAAVIAVTRVTYGAHFPSDVLAGLVLGYAAVRVVLALAGHRRPRLDLLALLRSDRPRRAARIGGALAIVAFGVLAVTEGIPVSPEGGVLGEAVERNVQIGLLLVAAAAWGAAWWREPVGAALVPVGLALGVLAALQYTPLFAVLACLAFLVPGVLFVLGWERVASPRAAASVCVAVSAALALGGLAAVEVHGRAYGPAHPQSTLEAPPTWRVQWAWAGGVTTDRATVNARLNADGRVRLLVAERRDLRGARVSAARRTSDGLGERIVSFTVAGLRPSTRFFYGLEFDGRLDRNRIGTFRTLPAGQASYEIAFSGCARVGSNGQVFDAIRARRSLMFLALGDFFYANIEEDEPGRFLDQYDRALGTPAQGALYRSTPIAYLWDDHDYGGDSSDASAESRSAARWSYRRAVPHYPLPAGRDGSIQQAFTIGRVRYVVMDTRSERRDDTMLGERQLRWVERELLAARDRYRLTVLVSSVPWIERADAGADGWGAYPAERARLARFIARHRIDRLMMLAGDAHMLAIDDGSHSDYSGTGRAGFPVMHAGALDRPGHAKGGPYSEGEYPGAGQYGTMRVDDGPEEMRVVLTGRDWRGREVVRHAFTVDGAG
jgi:membrane-associated phospholipid phosphatase/predicted MFS family arabinose efflux permease